MKKVQQTIGTMRERFACSKLSDAYQLEISVFLRDVGLSDDDPLSFITEKKISEWVKVMRDRGLKQVSIKHYLVALRVFTRYCGLNLKFQIPKVQTDQLRFYTEDEIHLLLRRPKKDFASFRTHAVIAFMLSTGARASTLINIKLEDIDWRNKEVYYRHLKNKKTAIIPLPDSLINILKEYLNTWDVEEYLFPDRSNKQLTVSALRQSINRYCKRCGVEPKSIHAFRHAFARLYIKGGGDAFTLQRFLTHSNMEMTRRYVTLFSDDLRAASNTYVPLNKLVPNDRVVRRRF